MEDFYLIQGQSDTYAVPLDPGDARPPFYADWIPTTGGVPVLTGALLISQQAVFPGPNPSVYAYTRVTTQRNIYRIPVP